MKPLTLTERMKIRIEVERQLATAITEGLVTVVGEDADGKTLFALTEKGLRHEESLTQTITEAAKAALL